jgi:phosphatidylglycerol---prolipoprotein diacylglyceryl transferase
VLQADFGRRRFEADPHLVIGISAITGLAGAKLYHVLETPALLASDPVGMLFSRTGFAWFGGFIAVIATLYVLALRFRIAPFSFLDACAPAAAVGYAVGRIGCLLSGDGDYGRPTSLPWGMSFPDGLVPTVERVHPTPIYEFLASAAIGWFIWRRAMRHAHQPGRITGEFLVLSGLSRFLVEFIRINPRIFLGTFSNAQVVAALSIIAGMALVAFSIRHTIPVSRQGTARTR